MPTFDIFRFVTLRGPQKISATNSAVNFINFIEEFDYDTSTFYTTLVGLLGNPDSYEQIVAEATTYAGTGDYYTKISDIDAAAPGFVDYYYATTPNLANMQVATIIADVTALFGGDIAAAFADAGNQATIKKFIDNLIADIILDKNVDKRNHLTALMIMLHIGKRIIATGSLKQGDIPSVFYATAHLPSPLFPLPYPEKIPPTPDTPIDYDALRQEIKERYELNEATIKSVLGFWNENTLKYANYEPMGLGTIPADESDRNTFLLAALQAKAATGDTDRITPGQWATLPAEQQTYLETFGLGVDDFRISRVLTVLEEERELIKKDFAGTVKSTRTVVAVGGTLYQIDDQLKQSPIKQPDPDLIRGECLSKPLAVADLRVVKQKGPCYKPGEIAHIENIMIGETRERLTRRLERSEETITTTTEKETEVEKTHQTTERYELQTATSEQLQQQTQFSAGLNVAASWGPVSIGTSLNFATSTSTSQSNQQSVEYAKETIDKAVSRVLERVKSERKLTLIREYEETISQKYENPAGEGSINQVGIYRWIDKEYDCDVQNYGKRLMYEFMVPEPAAFHLYMKKNNPNLGLTLQSPNDPVKDGITMIDGSNVRLTSFNVLDENNYAYFVAAYNVTGVEPPPPMFQVVSLAINNVGEDNKNFTASRTEIKVPSGYFAQYAQAAGGTDWGDFIMLAVGANAWSFGDSVCNGSLWQVALSGETDIVPVSYWSGRNNDDQVVYLNITVFCRRSGELKDAWKLKTFDAIMNAYLKQKQDYDAAVNALKSEMAFSITGTNPAFKREIEKTELKKGALRIVSKKSSLPIGAFDAMHEGANECGYPDFDVCDSMNEGKHIRFMEETFDWEHMTYNFYAYFYARMCHWKNIYQLEDEDYLFNQFLKAGYARVLVPVTPGMERHVLYYIQTGLIWDGETPPVSTDSYIQSLLADLDQEVDIEPTDMPDPWTVRIPTTLVALQCQSGCIDEEGLPCLTNES